jgi:hypothetical protein
MDADTTLNDDVITDVTTSMMLRAFIGIPSIDEKKSATVTETHSSLVRRVSEMCVEHAHDSDTIVNMLSMIGVDPVLVKEIVETHMADEVKSVVDQLHTNEIDAHTAARHCLVLFSSVHRSHENSGNTVLSGSKDSSNLGKVNEEQQTAAEEEHTSKAKVMCCIPIWIYRKASPYRLDLGDH